MPRSPHALRSSIAIAMLCFLVDLGYAAEPFTPARVAVYFSPYGGATAAVVHEVSAAQQQILVQAYSWLRSWRRPLLSDSVRRKSTSRSKEQGVQGLRPLSFQYLLRFILK